MCKRRGRRRTASRHQAEGRSGDGGSSARGKGVTRMSDGVMAAIVGVVGTVIGAGGAILVAVIQSRRGGDHPAAVLPGKVEDPTVVLGELVDIRELRILRAL